MKITHRNGVEIVFDIKMVAPEKEQLWDSGKVGCILRRYEYTGAFIGGRTKADMT